MTRASTRGVARRLVRASRRGDGVATGDSDARSGARARRAADARECEQAAGLGEQLEAAVKRDPGESRAARRARPRVLGPQRLSARACGVSARGEGRSASAEAHNWLGVALSEKADLPGAIAAFRKAVALDPKYGRAYTNLGVRARQERRLRRGGRGVPEGACRSSPTASAPHMNLGMALREKGDLDGALRTPAARRSRPIRTNAGIQYELGQTLRQTRRSRRRRHRVREGARDRSRAARRLLRARRHAEAAERVRRASRGRRRRVRPTISYRARRTRPRRGELTAAREQLDRGAASRRHVTRRRTTCSASSWASRETCRSALAHLERAVALQPGFAEAHYNLGVALWYSGSKDERAVRTARERQRSIRRPAPATPFSASRCATRAISPGARLSLQRAIALLPPTAAVYVDLGITYLARRRAREGARTTRSRAESAVAGRPDARLGRARLPASGKRWPAEPRANARKRTTCWACCSAARAPTAATWPPRSARPSGCDPISPRPTTISVWC